MFCVNPMITFFPECNNTTVIDESNAYKCLDLIYTSVLLEKGLGLSKDKELIVS